MPPPARSPLFANIDGVQVHHTLTPPSFPSPHPTFLICVHGFGASLFSFSHLKSLPLTLLPFDLPGFGQTSRPTHLRYYTPNFGARIISALISAYSPDHPVALCAHSMGSLSAFRATFQSPRTVAALILIAPAVTPSTPLPKVVRIFARFGAGFLAWVAIGVSFVFAPVLAIILRKYVGSRAFWRRGLAMAREEKVSDESLEGYFAPTRVKGWAGGLLNFSRASLMDRARALGEGEDMVGMMVGVEDRPPILIVHGDCDRIVPLANSKRLAEYLPGAKLVVMKGCGHVPHEERPEEFCSIVAAFLERVGVGADKV